MRVYVRVESQVLHTSTTMWFAMLQTAGVQYRHVLMPMTPQSQHKFCLLHKVYFSPPMSHALQLGNVMNAGKPQDQKAAVQASQGKHTAAAAEIDMTGFGQCIGNGLFWLAPFVLYFLPLSISGFSLFDNGHLQDGLER